MFVNDDSEWAKVAVVYSQLWEPSAAPPQEWIVVARDAAEAAAFVQAKALSTATRLKDAHIAVNGEECATPWLLRDGEFGRNFFLRLRDGWLLRAPRRGVMHMEEGRDEEWGSSAAEAFCALARRNPSTVLPWIRFL